MLNNNINEKVKLNFIIKILMESITILNSINIEKIFNQWKINLIKDLDLIIFKIENNI